VSSAAYSVVPVFQGYHWSGPFSVEGHQAKDGEDTNAHKNIISPGYLKTMGIRLLAGRDFDGRDRFHGGDAQRMPSVALVNRSFAEHFFGNESPIGRRIGQGTSSDTKLNIRIIGVVEDSLYDSPRDGVPLQVFYAHAEAPFPLRAYFYVRTTTEPTAIFPTLRRIVAKLDPSMPVDDMKTLATQLDETLSTERLIAALSVVFGALATVLAALGLYGVMAFVVTRRTREIGLRVALGAAQSNVLWLVLREVLILLGAGLAVGVPVALLLSRYVASQLFGVTPTDAWTCAVAIGVLGTVGAISAFVPARRASAIDPVTALRYE
jgi:predicted permease